MGIENFNDNRILLGSPMSRHTFMLTYEVVTVGRHKEGPNHEATYQQLKVTIK